MNTKTTRATDRILIVLLSTALIMQVSLTGDILAAGWIVSDGSACSEQLDQADELYYNGNFDQAILLVQKCLKNRSVDKPILIRAYTILSRIYLAQGDNIRSKENILHILNLDPSYEPTIEEETPKYVNLVSEVRQDVVKNQDMKSVSASSDSTAISPWVWIGAGSAAVAIIAIIASGNSDSSDDPGGNQPLPEPPSYPERR